MLSTPAFEEHDDVEWTADYLIRCEQHRNW
jgi:hypothetical protein